MGISTYLSITTSDVNGLNAPIKKYGDWIPEQDPCVCCLQDTHFRVKHTHRWKLRGWKKIFHTNGINMKVEVAILKDKRDF